MRYTRATVVMLVLGCSSSPLPSTAPSLSTLITDSGTDAPCSDCPSSDTSPVDVNVPGTDAGWDVGETCTPDAECACGGGTIASIVCTGASAGYCACEPDNADAGPADDVAMAHTP